LVEFILRGYIASAALHRMQLWQPNHDVPRYTLPHRASVHAASSPPTRHKQTCSRLQIAFWRSDDWIQQQTSRRDAPTQTSGIESTVALDGGQAKMSLLMGRGDGRVTSLLLLATNVGIHSADTREFVTGILEIGDKMRKHIFFLNRAKIDTFRVRDTISTLRHSWDTPEKIDLC
jgi:hypothetical protein